MCPVRDGLGPWFVSAAKVVALSVKGKAMKLWLVKYVPQYDYDEYDSMVIRAASEDRARAIAVTLSLQGCINDWSAEEISGAGVEEVVCGSFHAG